MVHELKCTYKFWPDYKSGMKNSSLRNNDRGFAVGDVVVLRLWDLGSAKDVTEPRFIEGEMVVRKISHIVKDYQFKEIPNGYCLLSLEEV